MFLIGLSYLDCNQTALAVALLVLAVSMSGATYSGHFVNDMDIAPQYAGTIVGISSGTAAISGIIAPYLASIVTESVSEFDHRIPTTVTGKTTVCEQPMKLHTTRRNTAACIGFRPESHSGLRCGLPSVTLTFFARCYD